MAAYFVTRHEGAVAWARARGIDATLVEHLDTARIAPGDTVIGTLPIQYIADLTCNGVRYFHLEINLPPELRGKPLDAAEMDRLGARIIEYRAERVAE